MHITLPIRAHSMNQIIGSPQNGLDLLNSYGVHLHTRLSLALTNLLCAKTTPLLSCFLDSLHQHIIRRTTAGLMCISAANVFWKSSSICAGTFRRAQLFPLLHAAGIGCGLFWFYPIRLPLSGCAGYARIDPRHARACFSLSSPRWHSRPLRNCGGFPVVIQATGVCRRSRSSRLARFLAPFPLPRCFVRAAFTHIHEFPRLPLVDGECNARFRPRKCHRCYVAR
jgi:hypothetical protein